MSKIQTVKKQESGGYLVDGKLSVPNDAGNRHYQEVMEWIAAGNTPEPWETTDEREKRVQRETQEQYGSAIQQHLDKAAQDRGYDHIASAVTYAEEPIVPKFRAEGKAFRVWRSLVWDYAYTQLVAVQRGERGQSTVDELLAELPALNIPK